MKRYWMAGLALVLATVGVTGAARAASFDARRAADISAFVTSHGVGGALKKGDDGRLYFAGQVSNTVSTSTSRTATTRGPTASSCCWAPRGIPRNSPST